MVNLLPGQDCGEHSTEDNEEMLIFLSGQGQAVIGDRKTLQIGKGKIIYIPPRTIHNIINNSDEPLCYVYCVSPTDSNSFDTSTPSTSLRTDKLSINRLRTMGEK
jgi:mannose-6-phosphate isomerase-like protein (cupin superfamily)